MMQHGSWSTLRLGLAASAALLLTAATGMAATGGLTISHPWMRYVIPGMPTASYFTLSNNSDHQVVLTGAASPECGQLMLHQSMAQNGMAQMQMVQSIPVPAHRSVTFSPGGYHLMCMSPAATIKPGQQVPVTLRFQDASSVSAVFPVYGAKGK